MINRRQNRFVLSLGLVLIGLSPSARAQLELPAEITVLGSMEALPGVLRERSLDPDTIAGYGVSSVDDLISELRSEMGDNEDDEPIYFLNGQRVRNLTDISGIPLEAIRLVEVLPTGSGARAGVSPSRRIYNIVVKADVKSETAVIAPKVATDGAWVQVRGEGTLTRINGEKRLNISVKARSEDSLRESERDILQLTPRRPYDFRGNVIADPRFAGDEVDPRLSALAGARVTVAAVPGVANPALSDFARGANAPNITNLGAFRTVRPKTNVYEFNVGHARPLASWLAASFSGRFNYTGNKSLSGLSSGLFVVTPGNPFSPFSQSVGLAKYGDPLRQNYRRLEGSADFELKATFGEWHANFHAAHQRTETRSNTDRQDPLQAQQPIVLGSSVNPFSPSVLNLISVGLDRSRYRTRGTTVEGDVKGQPLQLPAGPVDMGLDARLTWNNLRSTRAFFATETAARLRRTERELHGTLNVPLTSRANHVLPAIGDLAANFEYGRVAFSNASHADRYHYGLTWTPREGIRFDASSYHARQTPGIEALGEPITFTSGVRLLDILRGETVDVTQISGGNPTLRAERLSLDRVSTNIRPIRKLNFNLNAEYLIVNRHDLNSGLPRESVPIWLAFPERFVRDESGRLTAVDFRPVNFDLGHQERLRYGFALNLRLDGASPDQERPNDDAPARSTLRLRISANHTIFLANRLDIGPGLPSVDLLGGGAIGIVGNRPGHQVDFSVNLGKPGMGLRLTGVYRGANRLQIRGSTGGADLLSFAPFTTLNLYAFIGGERFRETSWLKGSRLGVYVANLTNVRQRVTNGAGTTPLRYQPGYRDPLGRTVEIEFRKQF